MKGSHGETNQSVHDINWGVFDHASHAPQLMSCVTDVCVNGSFITKHSY